MDGIISCRQCQRLVAFRESVKQDFSDYYCLPVESFGDRRARLLIVGLAPGKHGANATGRAFTGDASGNLLFKTLHKFGFANRSNSVSVDDGMALKSCRITNAVKCLPPKNKPLAEEINRCNHFLRQEINALPTESIVLALGAIAHKAVIKALDLAQNSCRFAHHARHQLSQDLTLIDSYHCSRYNTQTRRLSVDMFEQVFVDIRMQLDNGQR
jgi:uracil-DNA glycosylase family 4